MDISGEQGQDTGFVLCVCMCCMSCKVARCNRCEQNVHKVCNVHKLQYVKWSGDLGELDKRRLLFIVLNRKGKAVDMSPAGNTADEPEMLETVEVSVIKTTGYMLCKT